MARLFSNTKRKKRSGHTRLLWPIVHSFCKWLCSIQQPISWLSRRVEIIDCPHFIELYGSLLATTSATYFVYTQLVLILAIISIEQQKEIWSAHLAHHHILKLLQFRPPGGVLLLLASQLSRIIVWLDIIMYNENVILKAVYLLLIFFITTLYLPHKLYSCSKFWPSHAKYATE